MSVVTLENVYLSYPIYAADTRSLKRNFIQTFTGGRLGKGQKGPMIVDALQNISFTLQQGDRLGLIGHNGAGKTTLLRVLAGVFEPHAGRVIINGKVSTLLDISVGMQVDFNAYENIKMRVLMNNLSKEKAAALPADIEEFTELGNFLSMPVKTYSAGMGVRLAFGISTAIIPEVLLLDEIFTAGDARFMGKAEKRMENLITQSKVLVMSSHNNEVIEQFCNKVLWLEHGTVKAFGETSAVLAQYTQSLG